MKTKNHIPFSNQTIQYLKIYYNEKSLTQRRSTNFKYKFSDKMDIFCFNSENIIEIK